MVTDFDFSRDFSHIGWKSTIILNVFRAFVAGCIWTIIFFLLHVFPNITQLLSTPIIWPMLLIFLFPLILILKKVIPVLGDLLHLVGIILYGPADPILHIIQKRYPQLVPLREEYPILSKHLVIFLVE
jgi:hypothetical protein